MRLIRRPKDLIDVMCILMIVGGVIGLILSLVWKG